MKASFAATLTCLCCQVAAATCPLAARAAPRDEPHPAGLAMTVGAPAPKVEPATEQAQTRTAAPTPPARRPAPDERRLLLVGLALMAAIALRRQGDDRP